MNVSKIINGALKQLGILASGETAQANELADALDCLHQLLAQWATSNIYVYRSDVLILKLDGSGTYRIVPKRNSENFCCEYEVSDCIACNSYEFTSEECTCGLHKPRRKKPLSADINAISETAWLDGEQITLSRDKNPTKPDQTPVTYTRKGDGWEFIVCDKSAKELKIKVTSFPEQFECDDYLMLPKQYERALRLSLALEIAPMFAVEPSGLLIRNHGNAMKLLIKSNLPPIYSKNDLSNSGIGVGACRHGWFN